MAKKKDKAKKKGGFFRSTYKTFLDVPSWLGYSQLKDTNKTIFNSVRNVFVAKERNEAKTESFEEAMARLGLSEKDIAERSKANTKFMTVFAICGLLALVYTAYLIWDGYYRACLLSFVVSALAFARAFQYSFWNFQMKNRKLGCTLKEWMSGKVD